MSFEEKIPEFFFANELGSQCRVYKQVGVENYFLLKQRVREAIRSQYESNLEVESPEWTDDEKVAYGVCKEIEKRLGL